MVKYIRAHDRQSLATTIKNLTEGGFRAYLVGSALETQDYNGIDLIVCPKEFKDQREFNFLRVLGKFSDSVRLSNDDQALLKKEYDMVYNPFRLTFGTQEKKSIIDLLLVSSSEKVDSLRQVVVWNGELTLRPNRQEGDLQYSKTFSDAYARYETEGQVKK